MKFTNLVPNVINIDIKDALKLFVDCLESNIQHDELKSDNPFCVIERHGLRINLFENIALAKEHNLEFRLVTRNIDEVHEK
jgi:hypothetical protein